MVFYCIKNNFFTKNVFFLLLSTDSSFGIITIHYYLTCIMNLRCFPYLTNHGNQSYCRPNSYLSNYLCSDVGLIKLSYIKGGLWIKQFSFSNLLCAQATWAITNHAPIGEYRLRFFPSEDFSCPYRSYPNKENNDKEEGFVEGLE